MKIQGILLLLVLLAIILAINPKLIKKMYNNILGRLLILLAIVFCAMNNVTLGLLITLCLIIVLNRYDTFAEGMDIMGDSPITTPQTIGDDNVVANSIPGQKINVVTNVPTSMPIGSRLSDLKAKLASGSSGQVLNAQAGGNGVDVPAMQQTINAVPSNTLPIQKMTSSEDVNAASQGTLDTNTLTENFCSKCAGV